MKTPFASAVAIVLASAAFAAESPTFVCGLTGKKAPHCCCAEQGDKLVCQQTGQALKTCCCTVMK
ncbi:MAG: hypothetical protein H0T83_01560 [Chthoniobacterales bacterium]|nr:hypothetical protein [Chthoniobacterales bacterium]